LIWETHRAIIGFVEETEGFSTEPLLVGLLSASAPPPPRSQGTEKLEVTARDPARRPSHALAE